MRKIIHIDMDCFYAAVEEKHNPSLKGKPVGIGGPPNSRSVLCTANYAARKYGVRAAMPSSQAVRKCPHLILVPPHFNLYKVESRKVRQILERFTDRIEPLSLDEAYLDVSQCSSFQGSATKIAMEIRRLIEAETGLTASAGVAPNKFLAKIASDWKKPNGIFVIRPQDVESFMPSLKVESLWGVGKVTAQKLHDLGFHTCADLQKLTEIEMKKVFGSRGLDYWHLCRGQDDREVCNSWERKSLSVEETFNQDLQNYQQVKVKLEEIYLDFKRRMEKIEHGLIRGHVVKFTYTDFTHTTMQQAMARFPSLEDFGRLTEKIWFKKEEPIRLLGIGVRLGTPDTKPMAENKDQLALFSE
jgi:DNA polymerase IV